PRCSRKLLKIRGSIRLSGAGSPTVMVVRSSSTRWKDCIALSFTGLFSLSERFAGNEERVLGSRGSGIQGHVQDHFEDLLFAQSGCAGRAAARASIGAEAEYFASAGGNEHSRLLIREAGGYFVRPAVAPLLVRELPDRRDLERLRASTRNARTLHLRPHRIQ